MSWTKTGNIRGPEGPPGQPPAAMNLDDLADVDVHLAATGMSLVKQASGVWHGENKSYTLDQLSDVDVRQATTGMSLVKQLNGTWQGENKHYALDDLDDVAIVNPVAGQVLTRTSAGWQNVAPAAPPSTHPSWGRWAGTQAQYDAITPHDPNTLYVITGG